VPPVAVVVAAAKHHSIWARGSVQKLRSK